MAENSEIERVLVTGASGYIGSHIVQQLQLDGYAVRGTVRSLENEAKNKHLKELCPDAAHKLELVEAQLENEESWKSAVDDCTYVMHVASPFPLSLPADENEVIKPAVDGVKNVLKAVVANGKVKRVILTSAGLAICGNLANAEFSEKDWPSDVDSLDPYPKSKTLAEKAAWEFVENLKEDEKFELVVVHPVGVVGPILSTNESTSTEIIKRLLTRNPPMVAKVNMPLIDVRDVAAGHIAAMKCPEAPGNRHILAAGNMWWSEIAAVLREEFKSRGYNVPTTPVPKFCIKMASLFMKDAKLVLRNWNKEAKFDNTRMREVLKIEPRDLKSSVIEMAYSLIEAGIVKKKQKYRGQGEPEPTPAGEGDAPAPTTNGPTTEAAEGDAAETKEEEPKTEGANGDVKTEKGEEAKSEEPNAEETQEEPKKDEAAAPAEETSEPTTKGDDAPAEEKTEEPQEPAQEAPKSESTPDAEDSAAAKGDAGESKPEEPASESTQEGASDSTKEEATAE